MTQMVSHMTYIWEILVPSVLINSSKHISQKKNSPARSIDNNSNTKVELKNKELLFEQSNITTPVNSKNKLILIQPSGKRETPRIEILPTNIEDWMLLSQRVHMFSSACIKNIITRIH